MWKLFLGGGFRLGVLWIYIANMLPKIPQHKRGSLS
jgi:hypothetical protein